jgi:hypothetical protein
MKAQQDAYWRDTAAALDLECFDHEGEPVLRKRATRDATLRGTVDGHTVSLSYGLGGHADGITVIEVRARRSLLLGLEIRSSAAARDARGRLTYPERMTVEGIDRAHTDTLFATPPRGPEILRIMEGLGKLGWALLADTRLRAQIEAQMESPDQCAKLTRAAVRAVTLAEEACEALGPSPWAARVLASMVPAAAPLGLQVDAAALTVRGRYRDCPIALTTEPSKEGYALVCRAELPERVDESARVERRTGLWERTLATLGLGTRSTDRALDRAFRVTGKTQWISPDVVKALVGAPERIDARITGRKLMLRDSVTDGDASEMLRVAIGIVGGITGGLGAPYR